MTQPTPAGALPAALGQTRLMAFVRTMLFGTGHGREDDEHPLPPGPWDPVIRKALTHMTHAHHDPAAVLASSGMRRHGDPQGPQLAATLFGPHPEPWQLGLAGILARHPETLAAIGRGGSFGDAVALNPQPLPPRYGFLLAVVNTLVKRAELLQELAEATARKGEQQGIIIVSGYIGRFSDDFCGTGFKLRWPFPGPRPNWFVRELDGIDLVVMATQFDSAARQSHGAEFGRSLTGAASRFAEAGLARLQ